MVEGCIITNHTAIEVYLPTTSPDNFTVLEQGANCTPPQLIARNYYVNSCYSLVNHIDVSDNMYLVFSYVNNCSPDNTAIGIILGVVLSIIFLVCISAVYVAHRNRQNLMMYVRELQDNWPVSTTSVELQDM